MFENMTKCKKSWKLFCEWIYNKYGYKNLRENDFFSIDINIFTYKESTHIIDDDFILFIMPFFFDEYKIFIGIYNDSEDFYFDISYNKNECYETDYYSKNRLSVSQRACEKAFEILEKNKK
jgi:hypothetical protein